MLKACLKLVFLSFILCHCKQNGSTEPEVRRSPAQDAISGSTRASQNDLNETKWQISCRILANDNGDAGAENAGSSSVELEFSEGTYSIKTHLFADKSCKSSLLDRVEEGTYTIGGPSGSVAGAKDLDFKVSNIFVLPLSAEVAKGMNTTIGSKLSVPQTGKPVGTKVLLIYAIEGKSLKMGLGSNFGTRATDMSSAIRYTRL